MNKRIRLLSVLLVMGILLGSVSCSKKDSEEEDMVVPEGYKLVWNDEFDAAELSTEDWNLETHSPGWVNHELQAYVASDEYVFVEDGNLVIRPVQNIDDKGRVSYSSGRINTANAHDIKYGWIEARIKFPSGKGFLPAFWMMPQYESTYGPWPKCGEIDIAEVLGNDTDTTYGTIHYGEPHNQNQGIYSLPEGDFSSEFHTFAVEWEPGLIRWYVDGEMFYETSDWYTKTAAGDPKPYPAPFDQPFHVILNVAVGGDWPGSPDETTVFDENACMYVDYVRMFQRDSYDENVERPERVLDMREADETGNFVHNSDFAEAEDLTDENDWKFQELNNGIASAEISDNEIIITTVDEGTEDYSVQLVQPGLPLEEGASYRYSFDAYADEDRQMMTAVTGPDQSYLRYFEDTKIDLTSDLQSYSFDFDMNEASDDNGRIEFNMGNQNSTANIHITNVRLEKIE